MTKNKALIIYHSADLDGTGSAYIAKKGLTEIEEFHPENVDYFGYNYDKLKETDLDFLKKYSRIIFVDVSMPIHYVRKIPSSTFVTLIDHHNLDMGYLDVLKDLTIQTILPKSRFESAILLTYKYFFKQYKIPMWVKLLSLQT